MQSINELVMNITDGARAAHAFACEGRAGEARRAFINDLAAGLLCTSPEAGARPCGRCPSCLQAAAGTSLDIVRMSRSTGASKTGKESYRVDDAAAFIERLSMGSYGRYLIGIIDEADTLSDIIQNKLLKTLEEPAPDTLILLGVSNRDNLLDTVQSRLSFVRTADYSGYTAADAESEGSDEEDTYAKLHAAAKDLAAMYADRKNAFHEVRSSLEKHIKRSEDALYLLNVIEDEFRERMTAAARGERQGSPAACAHAIEEINNARMDIRRDMQHTKALKRLYLSI
jgi:DNA polymerase III delta prime subunit